MLNFFSVKSDVQRRFRAPICNQLFKRARALFNYERRQLKSREQLKLYKLHRNSNTRHRNSNTRLSTGHIKVGDHQNQHIIKINTFALNGYLNCIIAISDTFKILVDCKRVFSFDM